MLRSTRPAPSTAFPGAAASGRAPRSGCGCRGRALICALPDEKDAAIVTARCRLGTQDAGAWLVSNGWARAVPDGPYAKAEETAKAAKMGIFGPPPDTSGLSDVPDAGPSAPLVDQPVLSDQGIEPEPAPEPLLEFPPPPPAP